MSIKHVKAEYAQICQDYIDATEELKELNHVLQDKIITEEERELTLHAYYEIKARWLSWTYFINLLYKPNKKNKKYNQVSSIYSPHSNNLTNIKQLKEDIKQLYD